MDLTESIAPKSDQLNAEDLLAGPRTFTIEKVNAGTAEQPVNVHLAELPGRPYRPSKSMRRIMVSAWGAEASSYVGRRITLYRNPSIKWGGIAVGGIEISHLSDLDQPLSVALAVTRQKRSMFKVAPLVEAAPQKAAPKQQAPARDFRAEIDIAAGDVDALRALWSAASNGGADAETLAAIKAAATAAPQADVR